MNEKIVGWIAIASILGIMGWIYKSNALTERQLQVVVAFTLGLGIFLRVVALRESRRTVLRRRRMYKEFWRRGEQGDTALDLPEEESIVLLGRIKGGKTITVLMIAGTLGALFFGKNLLGLILALGQAFLAAKLYLIARNLDKVLLPDSERALPQVELPEGNSDKYLVEINLQSVHDFIRPQAALPFWSPAETEKWLAQCGFRRTGGRKWEGNQHALRFLDPDEIISIERTALS